MPSLQDLPFEIIVQILRSCPDLATLDSILCAWPDAYYAFNASARELTETVLFSGYTCGHVRSLFRLCALIRCGTIGVNSLPLFQELIIRNDFRFHARPYRWDFGIAPASLPPDISPATLRSLLATARQATNIAAECLDFYLARLRRICPERPADRRSHASYGRPFLGSTPQSMPWYPRQKGTPLRVHNARPLCWSEHQRATRAVWRLQLVGDLKRAGRLRTLGWPEQSYKELESVIAICPPVGPLQPASFYGTRRGFRDLLAVDTYVISPQDAWYINAQYHVPSYSPEYEEMNSLIDFVEIRYGVALANRMRHGDLRVSELQGVHQKTPPHSQIMPPAPDMRSWRLLAGPAPAVKFVFSYCTDDYYSPLRFVSFDEFSQYGFAFWAGERLQDYGLAASISPPFPAKIHYAWYSVLSEEHMEAVERMSRSDAQSKGQPIYELQTT